MEKLSCKDLMVGDWVKVKHLNKTGKVYRIDAANGSKNGFVALLDGDFSYDDIEPIPLTPEILEKNGFEEAKHYYPYPTYEFIGIERCIVRVEFPKGSNETIHEKPFVEINGEQCWVAIVDTEYVHELQHALKLCKINKEIEL